MTDNLKSIIDNKSSLIDKLYNIRNVFIPITNFTKEEIQEFNNVELKYNCHKYSLNPLGSKKELMGRLWGIVNPDEMPIGARKKKRGRKSTKSVESDTRPEDLTIYKGNKQDIIETIVRLGSEKLYDIILPYLHIFVDIEQFTKEKITEFNKIELEFNCHKYSVKSVGSKSVLVDRLWGIVNPDEMPEDALLKKRGRKNRSENINSLDEMIKKEQLQNMKRLDEDYELDGLESFYINYNCKYIYPTPNLIYNVEVYVNKNKNIYLLNNNVYTLIGKVVKVNGHDMWR